MKIKYSIYDIDEIDSNEKEAQILVCGENAAYILKINFGEENDQYISMKKYYYPDITFEKIIRLNKDSYIFTGINGTLFSNNTFSKKHIKKEFKIISNEPYKNGIQINKKIFAFISNNIYPTGHDNLMFYNMEKGKNIHTIKEYSFNPSVNSLYLINIDEKNSYKYLLLCACKKYEYEQKNGILLVYMNLKNEYEFYHIFYETNEFEVYCFCPISIVDNENDIKGDITDKNNIKKNSTDYFFVGGFDESKGLGMIKLFKTINKENGKQINLEEIQDVMFKPNDEFGGFEGAISCMIQSDLFGNILIACWDGNIYLMNPPNINFYLEP